MSPLGASSLKENWTILDVWEEEEEEEPAVKMKNK